MSGIDYANIETATLQWLLKVAFDAKPKGRQVKEEFESQRYEVCLSCMEELKRRGVA